MSEEKVGIIACAVMREEVQSLLPSSVPCVFLEQDLHNTPEKLHDKLSVEIARMEQDFLHLTAIVLVYGLCSKVIEGLCCKRCRLVIPRAHDCITLLLGDKDVYASYVEAFPGTYWYSRGWIATNTQPGPERYDKTYGEYCQKFDEDDALYLMETEQAWMKEYNRACYIQTGVEEDIAGVEYTRSCAKWLGWGYDFYKGSDELLRLLLGGNWDEGRFLVLEPGESAVQVLDKRVIKKA